MSAELLEYRSADRKYAFRNSLSDRFVWYQHGQHKIIIRKSAYMMSSQLKKNGLIAAGMMNIVGAVVFSKFF